MNNWHFGPPTAQSVHLRFSRQNIRTTAGRGMQLKRSDNGESETCPYPRLGNSPSLPIRLLVLP